ncbi:segregation/condensation protein A [Clostridium fallax]|uniref:Segregation and condensation protein A n=1 Tax=Clostridium fallax TaxID=1533 RepID=A0A1M4XZV1_9CLOT|nr:segregation/condensation protein A [Clostridium fallax]SHE98833.1 condensin subunit ScpA [Clostridium fallax]SQB06495.1 segregation and condensation protein A [Clostridium fallax]
MSLPNIKVTGFEGPFDLLLHLIKKNKMDIYDIKIWEITNKYLEYINKMKELDLEVTSEFIVIAATLIEIKSKTLLPKPPKEEEEEEDPKEKLLERLIEYKKIKLAAQYLNNCSKYTGDVYTKKAEVIELPEEKSNIKMDKIFKNISMLDLYNLYNDIMNRYLSKQNSNLSFDKRIPIDKYKVEEKMEEIFSSLKDKKIIEFSEFIYRCECKLEAVVSFLALLELIKIRKVKVVQNESFGSIYIERMEIDG